jgi:transcriptional regulator GlxA family with amidase domain
MVLLVIQTKLELAVAAGVVEAMLVMQVEQGEQVGRVPQAPLKHLTA